MGLLGWLLGTRMGEASGGPCWYRLRVCSMPSFTLHAPVCVVVFACVHVCVHACARTCVHVQTRVGICVSRHTRMLVCESVCWWRRMGSIAEQNGGEEHFFTTQGMATMASPGKRQWQGSCRCRWSLKVMPVVAQTPCSSNCAWERHWPCYGGGARKPPPCGSPGRGARQVSQCEV